MIYQCFSNFEDLIRSDMKECMSVLNENNKKQSVHSGASLMGHATLHFFRRTDIPFLFKLSGYGQ